MEGRKVCSVYQIPYTKFFQLFPLYVLCSVCPGMFLQSKGGILAKACDHINELRSANIQMAESLKETERLSVDAELLRQQCEELKQENTILRATLQQHGIVVPEIVSSGS